MLKSGGIFAGLLLTILSVNTAHAAIDFVIITVPAMEGARFELNGERLVADASGVVRTQVPDTGVYTLKALDFTPKDPRVKAKFQRWCCVVDTKTEEVEVPVHSATREIQAGYELTYLVDAKFKDPEGNPVDPSLVDSIQIKNDKGLHFELDSWTPQWLLGLTTTRVRGGLTPIDVRYRLLEAYVSGSNVVNTGQQALLPAQTEVWDVELLFYNVKVQTSDYLYGHPTGSEILLVLPNGEQRNFKLENGAATLESLPRGDYEIGVKGKGITLMQPLALSRNQDVQLDYVSYLDVMTGVCVGLVVITLLLLIGRPHLGAQFIRKLTRTRKVVLEK